jgi:alpha-L-rhamnosidase
MIERAIKGTVDFLPEPVFSWKIPPVQRGTRQKAYRIIVSSSVEKIFQEDGDVWDSGKIDSDKNSSVSYGGTELSGKTVYLWRIQWWNGEDESSPFSDIFFLETGISSWSAKWITMDAPLSYTTPKEPRTGESVEYFAMYFRKDFSLQTAEKSVQSARIYACGLGFYEVHLNGLKLGEAFLEPPQSDYTKGSYYSIFDITHLLKAHNCISAVAGNGRYLETYGYGKPRIIIQTEVRYDDGTSEIIATDESWRVSHGAVRENSYIHGTRYDAREELTGWDLPDYSEENGSWSDAVSAAGVPLRRREMEPIRATEVIEPVEITSPEKGVYLFDFGRNYSGVVQITATGEKGREIILRHGELLHPDGTLNTATNKTALVTDYIVLKGSSKEKYYPPFTQHGFRYLEITNYPGIPTLDSAKGICFHSDVEKTGSFSCSNNLINKIHRNICWGQLSNLMSIPTDSPQRDERQGWMGDAHLVVDESIHNFDMLRFYRKWLRDIIWSQKDDGSISDVVPPYWPLYPADPSWGSAFPVIAWSIYWYYDDKITLEKSYQHLKKYYEFLRESAEGYIQRTLGKYGDWSPPGNLYPKKTPLHLTATWSYYHDTLLMKKIASVLELNDDEAFYQKESEAILEAFNNEFLTKRGYAINPMSPKDRMPGQTSNVLPMALKMCPEEQEQKVIKQLTEGLVRLQGNHVDTGILGTRYLFGVLDDIGMSDTAYKVITQESYPGYGYMIREGATTLWERWENLEGGGVNSHNHIMLGSVDTWFYGTLCGIKPVEPGWRRIRIKPYLPHDMTFASASMETPRGLLKSSWERDIYSINLNVTIPPGTTAEVWIPCVSENIFIFEGDTIILEKGKSSKVVYGVEYAGAYSDYEVFNLESGCYFFESREA